MVGEIKGEIAFTPLEKAAKKHLQITHAMMELMNVLSS